MEQNEVDQIVVRCREGSKEAFRRLVREYQSMFFSLTLKMLCDEKDAEDACQDTFVNVWLNLHKYNSEKGKRSTWIYAIASNICLDKLKRRKPQLPMPSDECTFRAYAANPSPERQLMNSEWVSIVRVLAVQLSPKQQLVFTLHVLENVPIEEIESITNMNAGKIKSNLYVAQQRINWPIPMSKFFTKDEIGFWLSGTPDLVGGLNGIEIDDITQRLKTKYTQWLVANDFELTYQTILKNYSRIAAKAIDKQRFVALHDTLLREYSRETDLTAIHMDRSKWFKKIFHSDVYSEILDNDTLMREVGMIERDFLALSMFNIDYKLTFLGADYPPTLSKLTGNRLMAGDVVISPCIIKKNLWAFALIGAVLILSLVLLALMRKKR
jgi:RNA polymerase sigma factor, sigma-70 family